MFKKNHIFVNIKESYSFHMHNKQIFLCVYNIKRKRLDYNGSVFFYVFFFFEIILSTLKKYVKDIVQIKLYTISFL